MCIFVLPQRVSKMWRRVNPDDSRQLLANVHERAFTNSFKKLKLTRQLKQGGKEKGQQWWEWLYKNASNIFKKKSATQPTACDWVWNATSDGEATGRRRRRFSGWWHCVLMVSALVCCVWSNSSTLFLTPIDADTRNTLLWVGYHSPVLFKCFCTQLYFYAW